MCVRLPAWNFLGCGCAAIKFLWIKQIELIEINEIELIRFKISQKIIPKIAKNYTKNSTKKSCHDNPKNHTWNQHHVSLQKLHLCTWNYSKLVSNYLPKIINKTKCARECSFNRCWRISTTPNTTKFFLIIVKLIQQSNMVILSWLAKKNQSLNSRFSLLLKREVRGHF